MLRTTPCALKKNVTKQTIYTEIISLESAISSTGFTRTACCRYVLDVFNGLSERPRLKLECSATVPTTTTQQYSLTFIRIIRPGNVGKVSCPEDTGKETREWARAGVQTTSLELLDELLFLLSHSRPDCISYTFALDLSNSDCQSNIF